MSLFRPPGPRRQPPVLSLLATFMVAAGVLLWLRMHISGQRPEADVTVCAANPGAPGCAPAPPAAPTSSHEPSSAPVLSAARACRDVGYLCAPLDSSASMVIRRWKDFHRTMVIHVPLPAFEDPTTARQLQNAAADGILLWNGQPFPIVVDRRGIRPAQFEVRWSRTLTQSRLGVAHTAWSATTGLRVLSLELTTRNPFSPSQLLGPRQVRLIAAHEMGHALGLPHSDQRRDVMYPENTATALTARDYRTVEALYSLADGTRIVR